MVRNSPVVTDGMQSKSKLFKLIKKFSDMYLTQKIMMVIYPNKSEHHEMLQDLRHLNSSPVFHISNWVNSIAVIFYEKCDINNYLLFVGHWSPHNVDNTVVVKTSVSGHWCPHIVDNTVVVKTSVSGHWFSHNVDNTAVVKTSVSGHWCPHNVDNTVVVKTSVSGHWCPHNVDNTVVVKTSVRGHWCPHNVDNTAVVKTSVSVGLI